VKEIIDGIIKYDDSDFQRTEPLNTDEYKALEYWRKKLYDIKLIGEYSDLMVGYGNLSLKKDYSKLFLSTNSQFLITGTQTGKYTDLTGKHYTRVLDFNVKDMTIKIAGPTQASSEALTHAAIYQCNEKINCVFHIHDKSMWQNMLKANCDSTSKEIPYGTYEMAQAVKNLIQNKTSGSIVMGGHEDGIIAYAENLDQCGEIILDLYKQFK